MKIYLFHYKYFYNLFPNIDPFEINEWNELDELPKEVIDLMKIAKENNTVYNPYNFMLDFNLQDKTSYCGDYVMFIPDPKFNIDI